MKSAHLQNSGFQSNEIFCVGFAAETQNLLENAREKLASKNLDLVVANDVSNQQIGFESDFNEVFLISLKAEEKLKKASKFVIAQQIISRLAGLYKEK